jgi:catechol 2,3-dioxygenase-like lactoylglutathione lyase family enzyme
VVSGSNGRRFSHVGVAVADLDAAVEFYKVFVQSEPFLDELVGYEKTKMSSPRT